MPMAKGGRRSDKKIRPKLGVIRIEKCHKFSKYKLFAEILDLPFLTTWPPYSLNRLICYICAWHHRTPPSPPTMCTVSQCIPICVLWNQYFLCLVYNSKRYSLLNKSFFCSRHPASGWVAASSLFPTTTTCHDFALGATHNSLNHYCSCDWDRVSDSTIALSFVACI